MSGSQTVFLIQCLSQETSLLIECYLRPSDLSQSFQVNDCVTASQAMDCGKTVDNPYTKL